MAQLKKLTPYAKECKEICEAEGLEVLGWTSGRNCHYKFRVRRKDGAEMMIVASATAGDRRSLDNHRSLVRRFVRAAT